ncbi:NfeD family protein [Halofilum ochraceum]|uniref:NfeD family protein n=1 Tax=Halofilum ochraceum TaxID=1611323 RepID=UPI00082E8885|nr:nodulation protein NfeD [Halofilum ochraceum]
MKRSRSTTTGTDRIRRGLAFLLALCGALLFFAPGMAQEGASGNGADDTEGAAPRAILLTVDGAIGPATTDYLTRGIETAEERGVDLLIIQMDTPGGLTEATRDIVKAIRGSKVAVATWVAPGGARAASAGTYILYASHVAAMAPTTNVGAATPVAIGGGAPQPPAEPEQTPDEEGGDKAPETDDGTDAGKEDGEAPAAEESSEPEAPDSASKRKALNDAAAWIRGLAQETGRNADWAERAVREAVSATAEEAVENNVADFIAGDIEALLDGADGREVKVAGERVTLKTAGATVERIDPDWRSELLAIITNPTVAYLLMMIGIYGLLLEGYNPGALVPGTVGAICLLLALYAFQVLPVNYAGLLLILLGIILIVSEALVPSFGVLGFGGIVSMIVGSIILMDTDVPGFEIAVEVIGSVATVSGAIMFAIAYMAVKAWRRPVVSGAEEIAQATGEVISTVDATSGWVYMLGERWQARSDHPIPPGTPVRVIEREGLVVRVEPIESDRE